MARESPTYLELITVTDHDIAGTHPFGSRVLASVEAGRLLRTWAVRADIEVATGRAQTQPTQGALEVDGVVESS